MTTVAGDMDAPTVTAMGLVDRQAAHHYHQKSAGSRLPSVLILKPVVRLSNGHSITR